MPIKVGCQCGQWFAAPDQLAGTTVPCPTCGKPIAIPGGAKAPAASPAAQAAPRPAAQAAARPAAAAAAKPAGGGLVVTCACGQSYKAPESHRGQHLPCPACGRSIPIPAAQVAARPGGLDPLGTSDPLADPLLSASLTGAPMAGGFPATDPLGRPLPQYGTTLGKPQYAASGDGPNWVIIGSVGGVAAVLVIMVIAIVAMSLSGGGSTPVAANNAPAPGGPAAPSTPAPFVPNGTSTTSTPVAPTNTAPVNSVPAQPAERNPDQFGNSGPTGAVPQTSAPMGTPGVAGPGGAPPGGTPPGGFGTGAPPGVGQPPTGVPGIGAPGIGGPGIGPGGIPGAGFPGAPGVPTTAGPGTPGFPGQGRPGTPGQPGQPTSANNVQGIIRIIPLNDPNAAFETPATVVANVKGLGTGLPAWHGDAKAKLIGVIKIGDAENRTSIHAHYSWMHNILPFIGHQAIYDKFDLSKPLHDKANFRYGAILVPEFLLPGDKRQRWEGYPFDEFALTHFVGMSGIEDSRNVVAGKLPRTDPRAGIFGYDKIGTVAEITDGTSSTIMVIGNGELANPWVMGGGATIRGARLPYFDKLTGFGSRGRSGPVVVLADGSIRMVNTNVDPAVFRAMCTMHGADTVDLNTAAPTATIE